MVRVDKKWSEMLKLDRVGQNFLYLPPNHVPFKPSLSTTIVVTNELRYVVEPPAGVVIMSPQMLHCSLQLQVRGTDFGHETVKSETELRYSITIIIIPCLLLKLDCSLCWWHVWW